MATTPRSDYVPLVELPQDFDEFWDSTLAEARSHGLDASVVEDELRSNDGARVFHAQFTSLERIRVSGWYALPRGRGPFPALLMLPGYGAWASLGVRALAEAGIATFWLSVRGHELNSPICPGFPGFLTHNITDRNRYIYRGAFSDAVLGIDFLKTQTEVDSSRIAVAGESQGGALTLVVAALADGIVAAAPDVPFLTDIRWSVENSSRYPYAEIADILRLRPSLTDSIWETLAYFDVANFAPKVSCPILASIGLKDDICPPAALLSMLENVTGAIDVRTHPEAGHEHGGVGHAAVRASWLMSSLGV